MTARLFAWLRSGCPAVASPWGWCLFQLGLLLLPSTVLLASLLFVLVPTVFLIILFIQTNSKEG